METHVDGAAVPDAVVFNGRSSSIRFAMYEVDRSLRRRLGGKIDRIGDVPTLETLAAAGLLRHYLTDMVVLNDLARFHLTSDVIDRVPTPGARAACVQQELRDERLAHKRYFATHGEDMPEIRDWTWSVTT